MVSVSDGLRAGAPGRLRPSRGRTAYAFEVGVSGVLGAL